MWESVNDCEWPKNSLYGQPNYDMELFSNRRKKVLVIDDDQDFRLYVSELLVDQGFSVTTAKDGETGLNHLVYSNELPDLILVDLMMPVKSGLEFRREQLKLAKASDIPVLFMTGHGLVEGESTLMKPFEEREFIHTVKSHFLKA